MHKVNEMDEKNEFSEDCYRLISQCFAGLDSAQALDIRYPAPPYTPTEEHSLISIPAKSVSSPDGQSKKRPWTPDEAQMLNCVKRQHPSYSYIKIAAILNERFGTNRDAKQVQQRWCRVQDPCLKKGCWSDEEDRLLQQLSEELNGSVKDIRKQMAHRTVVQIRTRMDYLGIRRVSSKGKTL